MSYPGEYCTVDGDCYYNGKCKSHKCTGLVAGDVCTSGQCSEGLYCDGVLCRPVSKKGDKCDHHFHKCSMYHVCYEGECINMFSLEEGTKVRCHSLKYQVYSNLYCSSGFAELVFASNTSSICTCTEKVNPVPTTDTVCSFNETYCNPYGIHSNARWHYSNKTQCQCGFDGMGHCPATFFDQHYFWAMTYFKKLMDIGQDCNEDIGITDRCFMGDKKHLATYYYFYSNMTYFENHPMLVSGNVEEVYFYYVKYGKALDALKTLPYIKPEDGSSFAVAMILTGIISLVV
jgi:hypothetical protein